MLKWYYLSYTELNILLKIILPVFFFFYFFSVATKNVLNYVAPILFLSHRVPLGFYFLYSQYPDSSSNYIALVIVHFGSMQQKQLWIVQWQQIVDYRQKAAASRVETWS